MATIVDAKYSTLVGTPAELLAFMQMLQSKHAGVVDLKFSNWVLLHEPPTQDQIHRALETTPASQRDGDR